MKKLLGTVIIFLSMILQAECSVEKLIQEGNRLYYNKYYSSAAVIYKRAKEKKEGPEVLYNLGNVFFKRGNYEKAAEYYNSAISIGDSRINQKTLYNLGNTEYEREKKSEAVEYWIKALIVDSEDEDARHNLLVALQEKKGSEQEKQDGAEPEEDEGELDREPETEDEQLAEQILNLIEHEEQEIKREMHFDISDFYGLDKLW